MVLKSALMASTMVIFAPFPVYPNAHSDHPLPNVVVLGFDHRKRLQLFVVHKHPNLGSLPLQTWFTCTSVIFAIQITSSSSAMLFHLPLVWCNEAAQIPLQSVLHNSDIFGEGLKVYGKEQKKSIWRTVVEFVKCVLSSRFGPLTFDIAYEIGRILSSDVKKGGETAFLLSQVNCSTVPWWVELFECGRSGLSMRPRMAEAPVDDYQPKVTEENKKTTIAIFLKATGNLDYNS